jgi:SNF2 family DNA or RNA helicase
MLEMRQELASFMVVRLKNDELPDLPAITVQQMRVTLSKGQRRVYDDLAKQFLANLPDGSSLLAPNVAVQLIRLRQVATGMDLLGDQFTDSSKLEAAEEVIEATLPNKVVVFVWHRRTAYALVKRLHDRGILGVSCVTGDSPMAKRPEMVRNFCEGENNVLIATIKTLGESVNLQAASDMIFVESSWTAADMDQARDRIYRNGQKKHVTITHIIAADTVDETHIMPKVADKAALRRMLLGGHAHE